MSSLRRGFLRHITSVRNTVKDFIVNKRKLNKEVSPSRDYCTVSEIVSPLMKGVSLNSNKYLKWEELDLEVFLSDGKPLQRELVWSIAQQQELIWSVIMNLPIPPIVIVHKYVRDLKTGSNRLIGKVVDGKQRITSLKNFCENKFSIIIDGVSLYFKDFSDKDKQLFTSSYLDLLLYMTDIEKINSDSFLVQLYQILNYRGTPHKVS